MVQTLLLAFLKENTWNYKTIKNLTLSLVNLCLSTDPHNALRVEGGADLTHEYPDASYNKANKDYLMNSKLCFTIIHFHSILHGQ
ncbi:unnamed protein product [Schistosoma margrebowiei]|uniref:Uncharacterized protein n=1 Tax=Schistosoma margrebowiei TaxID=48269 RepID=A0AA84ZKT3_9TREM|nr:unnamed protein product [Schistosoma margrebowiei]